MHLRKWTNITLCFSDGDSKKAECDNSTNITVPVSGTSTTSGLGRRKSETSYYDRTERHHWGECVPLLIFISNYPHISLSTIKENILIIFLLLTSVLRKLDVVYENMVIFHSFISTILNI